MTAPRRHQQVLRYFSVLVGVLAMAAVITFVVTWRIHVTEDRAHVYVHHRRAIDLIQSMGRDLAAIYQPSLRPGAARSTDAAIRSLVRAVESVGNLEEAHGNESSRAAAQRLGERLDRLLKAVSDVAAGDASVSELRAAVESFVLSAKQLERFHSIAVREEMRLQAEASASRDWTLVFVLLGVLVVTGAIVLRLFFLVRSRLEDQAATERALLERERQLQQSQRLESLGTLVGGVAHDFNNLLTAMLGHADVLLARLPKDDAHRAGVMGIVQAGERATSLTRQLLAFGRAELTERRVIDLGHLLSDLDSLLRRVIRADIELVTQVEPETGHVRADPAQLEQVLINLAVNARDAMPGGGRLEIQCCAVQVSSRDGRGLPPGQYARLTVMDTGCGMTAETRARMFEPFFTTKLEGRGTGLGLSMVHGIVTKSGGHVTVSSELGGGTSVDVYLPRHAAPLGVVEVPVSGELERGRETVLLVEDQEQVREVALRGLQSAGYRVLVASDGLEGERIAAEHDGRIDLVLSDIVMPNLRGPDLVARLLETRPDLAVVFMSGYTETELVERVRASGHALVLKPFRLRQLLQVVRRQLDGCPAEAVANG